MEDVRIYNYVKIGDKQYKTGLTVETAIAISFCVYDMTVDKAAEVFADATEFCILDSDGKTEKGIYKNLSFTSATVDATGTVTVNMALADDTAVRLSGLEKTQAEQDEVLASLLFGGGEEDE